MKLQGIVQVGEGNASFWLEKYSEVYERWTGMTIVPGSLNVDLPVKFDWDKAEVLPYKRVYSLVPYGGNRDICLVPCEIYRDEANRIYGFAWGTTNATNEPGYKVLEIITSVNLRETLQLRDGTIVTVEIPLPWKA